MNRSLSGNPDVDKLILLQLSDKDLQSICVSDKYIQRLCQDDYFWMNRTVKQYGRIIVPDASVEETAKTIRDKYLGNSTWKEYYTWLTKMKSNPDKGFLVGMINNRDDIFAVLDHKMKTVRSTGRIMSLGGDLFYVKPEILESIKSHLEQIRGSIGGFFGLNIPEPHSLWDYLSITKQYGILNPMGLINIMHFIIIYYRYNRNYLGLIDNPNMIDYMKIHNKELTKEHRRFLTDPRVLPQLSIDLLTIYSLNDMLDRLL